MAFIQLEQINFRWPQGPALLRDINLALNRQDTVALVGSNGCGKTTLGKLIMGLLSPTQGRVLLDGRPVGDYPLAQRGERVGYVFQNPEKQLFAASVADEVGFALRHRGLNSDQVEAKVEEMLALFELERRRDAFPFNLSHGEKQRLALAAVLALDPEFVLLDEPSTGLDWLRKRKLAQALEKVGQRGVGYIIISHDHGFCRQLCARTLTLEGGKLYE